MSAAPKTILDTIRFDIGRDAQLERVDVTDVVIDDEYQRVIRPYKVRKLIREWDPTIAGWIIVSRRKDGALYVIDGQHRVAAVKELQGEIGPYLDAIVVRDWSQAKEASFFHRTQDANSRAAVSPAEIHHAALTAGDRRAHWLDAILRAAGMRIGNRDIGGEEGGRLNAVNAAYKVFDKHGPQTLADTLTIITGFWGTHCSPRAEIVEGIGLFLAMYPHVDAKEVARRAPSINIEDWYAAASGYRGDEGKLTKTECVARKLRAEYNYRRSTNVLASFTDSLRDYRFRMRSQARLSRERRDEN